jgi:PST family polysaccharide transporter
MPSPADAADAMRPREAAAPARSSYGQILRSSALIGASSSVNVLFRVIRVKVMALLLGPTGVGLLGLYSSVSDLSYSLSCMGIDSSGVRQIAHAAGTGDEARLARTVYVMRRIMLFMGLLGAGLLVALAKPVSVVTFGSGDHAALVALLAFALFFRVVYASQATMLHGMRRIGDLAKMEVLGALLATLIGIPLIFWLRERGVVPFLVATAGAAIVLSWWYSRKVRLPAVSMSAGE